VITVFTALSHVAGVPFVSETLTHAFIYMAAALTVTSGIHYAIVVQHHYTPSSSEEASEEPGTRKPMTK